MPIRAHPIVTHNLTITTTFLDPQFVFYRYLITIFWEWVATSLYSECNALSHPIQALLVCLFVYAIKTTRVSEESIRFHIETDNAHEHKQVCYTWGSGTIFLPDNR